MGPRVSLDCETESAWPFPTKESYPFEEFLGKRSKKPKFQVTAEQWSDLMHSLDRLEGTVAFIMNNLHSHAK